MTLHLNADVYGNRAKRWHLRTTDLLTSRLLKVNH